MSWDLVFWKGAPTADPPEVWSDLAEDREVRFIAPLTVQEIRTAFEAEYGQDLRIENYDEDRTTIMGRGWEGSLADGEAYFYVCCGWGLAQDDDWLTQIVRAGLRAGCYVFDPQSGSWWDRPEPGWVPDTFEVWDAVRSADEE